MKSLLSFMSVTDWLIYCLTMGGAIVLATYAVVGVNFLLSSNREACEANGGVYVSGSDLCIKKDAVI